MGMESGNVGERERRAELLALFEVADGYGDGRIDFDEFCRRLSDLDLEPSMDRELAPVATSAAYGRRARRVELAESLAWWADR
jgi:hypothetical protein